MNIPEYEVIATVTHKFTSPEHLSIRKHVKMGVHRMFGCLLRDDAHWSIFPLDKLSHEVKNISMDEAGNVEIQFDIFKTGLHGDVLFMSLLDNNMSVKPVMVFNLDNTLITCHFQSVLAVPS